MSVEVCQTLVALVRAGTASAVADLGSGFSSFCLRKSVPDPHSVRIVTVDTEGEWLDSSQAYLSTRGVRTDGFEIWKEFTHDRSHDGSYDVVFHDLAVRDRPSRRLSRLDAAQQAIRLARPGGIVIFDDVHKTPYRVGLTKLLRDERLAPISLRHLTLDGFGRFAWAVRR